MELLKEAMPFLELGPTGLLGVVVMLILTDRLVTRKRIEELRSDHSAIDTERQATISFLRGQINVLTTQNTLLIRGGETTRHVVESLPRGGVDDV